MSQPRPDPIPAIDEYQSQPVTPGLPARRRVSNPKLPHILEPTSATMILQNEERPDPHHPLSHTSARQRGDPVYKVELSRAEINQLCQFLQVCSMRGEKFIYVREAVLFAELIRVRAKRAGF